jgi:hypothetical protein
VQGGVAFTTVMTAVGVTCGRDRESVREAATTAG